MADESDLPKSPLERATLLQNEIIAHATGGHANEAVYVELRREFMSDPSTEPLLPAFVRTCRSATQIWGYIKNVSGTYQGRREHIWAEFVRLLDHLEGKRQAPADDAVTDALKTFDPEGVHAAWAKALDRRKDDAEGAITSARTLLETVCKRILDEMDAKYPDGADLPALYGIVAKALNLAPSQQTEDTFRAMLGGCQTVVERIGAMRNKLGDAHGKGAGGAKPDARHAELAVNLAGSMATFLVQTWQAAKSAA